MDRFVSVIIPTYGGSSSLKNAIESAINQDYPFLEVIVVDDNNPETKQRADTELIMSDYEQDDRVIYICHEKNMNGAAARNTGARASKGEYLALLDDDDVFLQGKIKKQVSYLESHKEYDAVYCWRFESGDHIVGGKMTGDLSAPLLDLTFTPCTCSLMIRKSAYFDIGGFDESYYRHQDFEFLLRFFKKYKIGVVEEPLIKIIGNGTDNQPRGIAAIEVKRKFLDTFSSDIDTLNQKYSGFRKRVYARHYAPLTVKLLRYGDIRLAVISYLNDGHKGGIRFWIELINQIIFILKKRLSIVGRSHSHD